MGADFNLFCQLFYILLFNVIFNQPLFFIKNCLNRYIKELLIIKNHRFLITVYFMIFQCDFSFTTTCNYAGLYFSSVKGKDKKPFFNVSLNHFVNKFYKHIFRSSCLQMFFKISSLKNFAILIIKKRLQHRRFL